jgi:hypothetical protein
MCTDTTIKDLLPAYVEQGLGREGMQSVKDHIDRCADCRAEVSLLRSMAEEPVPDPGPAFWASMPDRVYRQVQEELRRPAGKGFDAGRFLQRCTLPRWAFTTATLGVVLVLSWFIVRQIPQNKEANLPQGYELSEPVISFGSVNMTELGRDEITVIDSWAAEEITSIAREVAQNDVNGHGADIAEELADLNQHEIEQLSTMIERLPEEV